MGKYTESREVKEMEKHTQREVKVMAKYTQRKEVKVMAKHT